MLQGKRLDQDSIAQAAQLAAEAARPEADLRGSIEYKRDMVRVLTSRALTRALELVDSPPAKLAGTCALDRKRGHDHTSHSCHGQWHCPRGGGRAGLLFVHFLRDVLRLTGTHIGCDTTHCGACTVLLDGKPIKSCTLFAVQADGRDVLTVEGLEQNGQLPLSRKGSGRSTVCRCGFCTPGMLMTGYALLQHNPPRPKRRSAGPSPAICAGARGMSTLSKRSSKAEKIRRGEAS